MADLLLVLGFILLPEALSETKKVTRRSFLDTSMHSLKTQHTLKPHLWIVQEGRNMPDRHSYTCGSCKWRGQNVLVHTDQICVAEKKYIFYRYWWNLKTPVPSYMG